MEAVKNRTMQVSSQHRALHQSHRSIQLGHDSLTHIKCMNTRANGSWCRGDISNMQDAGISLERSAAAGEGQWELSCQSCMQQAVQYHITSTTPVLTHVCRTAILNHKKKLVCKVILQNQIWFCKMTLVTKHRLSYSTQMLCY